MSAWRKIHVDLGAAVVFCTNGGGLVKDLVTPLKSAITLFDASPEIIAKPHYESLKGVVEEARRLLIGAEGPQVLCDAFRAHLRKMADAVDPLDLRKRPKFRDGERDFREGIPNLGID